MAFMKAILPVLFTGTLLSRDVCARSDASRITWVLDRYAEIFHRTAKYNGNPGAQANFVASNLRHVLDRFSATQFSAVMLHPAQNDPL